MRPEQKRRAPRSRTRRDDVATRSQRCRELYQHALVLQDQANARAGRFAPGWGALGLTPNPEVPIGDVYRAWHAVVDAWEVADDACQSAYDDPTAADRAEASRYMAKEILRTMRVQHEVDYRPQTIAARARLYVKYAQREAAVGGDRSIAIGLLIDAASFFERAGELDRARVIRRYIRALERPRSRDVARRTRRP